MDLLDSDEAVEDHFEHLLNNLISRNLMDLLEEILQDTNNYAKGYIKILEVENDVNQPADSLGQ